jgi:DNA-binding NarL/FixJ family response regulator
MAATQAEGQNLLSCYEPDWVVVSCELLYRAGRAFMEEVRSTRPTTRVAILAETGIPAEVAQARRLGPDSIYTKPVDPEHVFQGCSPAREPKAVG